MKITIVNTTRKRYGGSAYENIVREALLENFDVDLISAGVKGKEILKYFEAPLLPWRIYKTSKRKEFDIVIRNLEAFLFLNEKPAKIL
ncbi:MAG: hypothetical protein PHO28_03780 [Candidatus Pacebacteria bacterium]|nr:hypothetical protein [Candidatus Paceibacterota bacterium]